jgi:hypothetical protein
LLALRQPQKRILPHERRRTAFASRADHRGEKPCLPDQRLVKRTFGIVEIPRDTHLCNLGIHRHRRTLLSAAKIAPLPLQHRGGDATAGQ